MRLPRILAGVMTIGIGFAVAWAATPATGPVQLMAPIPMVTDAGDTVIARDLLTFDHPLGGQQNFKQPNTVTLPDSTKLTVQDVLPVMGIEHTWKNCADIKGTLVDLLDDYLGVLTSTFTNSGIDPKITQDYYAKIKKNFDTCDAATVATTVRLAMQPVADVRNDANGGTITFNAQSSLSPYFGQLPLGSPLGNPQDYQGFTGTIIGGAGWVDGAVIATYPWQVLPVDVNGYTHLGTLQLLRFTGIPARLENAGLSESFHDNPKNKCMNAGENATPEQLTTLGCVDENLTVGVVALNFFGNGAQRYPDLITINRDRYGTSNQIGYSTIYRGKPFAKTNVDLKFKDEFQYETALSGPAGTLGMPEPYGITVLKNAGQNDSAVVASRVAPQGNRYYVYRIRFDVATQKPVVDAIKVGCIWSEPNCLDLKDMGPYKIAGADLNNDGFSDLAITLASVVPNAGKPIIKFSPQILVMYQNKDGSFSTPVVYNAAILTGDDNTTNIKAGLSNITVANMDKDNVGKPDLVATDFSSYVGKDGKRHNYIHVFLNQGTLFGINTLPYPTNSNTGVSEKPSIVRGNIALAADSNANISVIFGTPLAFVPVELPPPPPLQKPDNPCINGTTAECKLACSRDLDKDGLDDLNSNTTSIQIKGTDTNGVISFDCKATDLVTMVIDTSTTYTYSCDGKSQTGTGRALFMEWMAGKCDNCNSGVSPAKPVDTCLPLADPKAQAEWALNPKPPNLKPGSQTQCYNPSQKDANGDGYGDICSPFKAGGPAQPPNAPQAMTTCADGTPYFDTWLTFFDHIEKMQIDNDVDKDGIPDCKVSDTNKGQTYNSCSQLCDGDVKKSSRLDKSKLREDKVMDWNAPVIAYEDEIKPAFTVIELTTPNPSEITILLNKTPMKTVVADCNPADLTCLCAQNPKLGACQSCATNPSGPGCGPLGNTVTTTCTIDVCRDGLEAPYAEQCEQVRKINDEARAITGLPIDPIMPLGGAQYHISCAIPTKVALDLGSGIGHVEIFGTGQFKENFFDYPLKPVASHKTLSKPVLLNPLTDTSTSKGFPNNFDVNVATKALPKVDFDFSALTDVVPGATINSAAGMTQIDNVLQIQTSLASTGNANVAAGNAGVPQNDDKLLVLDMKGYTSPGPCQWTNSGCPEPARDPISTADFLRAVKAMKAQHDAAGLPMTGNFYNDVFKSIDAGPEFYHQTFRVSTGNGTPTGIGGDPVLHSLYVPMQQSVSGSGCSLIRPKNN